MTIVEVLVVDDDLGTRETFAFVLRDAGMVVRVAETGDQAIHLARQSRPTLVLCDLHLPDTTALDVLKTLRQSEIDTPFVVVTAFGTVMSALEAGRLGVVDYLEKPVALERLLSVVTNHLNASPEGHGRHDPTGPSSHAVRAKRVIEERYAEPNLGVRVVARSLGLSTQHVCRVLKHHAGLTFAELLRNVRLREARRLLGEPTRSMKEISYQVGFRYPSQFTRAFRDDCGLSPSEYKARRAKYSA